LRAYRIVDWGEAPRIVDAPVPEPGPGEVLVRVAANGLCHSDSLMAQMPAEFGVALGWRVPFTLGHEVGGWVAALGDGVDEVHVGDPVALVSPSSCGFCDACRRGAESDCARSDFGRGFGRDGGLAPYVVAGGVRELVPLGDLDPVAAGPLTDAGATSLHAVKRALAVLAPRADRSAAAPRSVAAGETVVVLGAGGLGSFAVQFLRASSGVRVVAVDRSPERRAVAAGLGAHEVLDGVDGTTVATLRDLTDGTGVGAVLDFVGVDATILCGLSATRRGGAYGLVGAGGGTLRRPWYGTVPRGGTVFTFQGSDRSDVHDAVALAASGRVVSHVETFAFDQVGEAYRRLEHGELTGRAVVVPDPV
jgi:propanol-preferring alcohol dehydrogenase